MSRKLTRRTFSVASAAAVAAVSTGPRVLARQDATPVEEGPGLPPLPEGATVVAEGLWNPRSIAIDEAGTLYVTETGIGGDEVLTPPNTGEGELEATPVGSAEATPVAEPEGPPSTRGYTGQITMVAPDGTASVLVDGLASYSDGVGPTGITVFEGSVYFVIGGAGVGSGIEPLPEENTVNRVDPENGTVELVAELGPYEVENNPDEEDINPNLYGIDADSEGNLFVVDAGGNTVYSVDPASSEFELVAVVPNLSELTGEAPSADEPPRQPVPTAIVVDADDVIHVALLSEGWPPDGPSVLTIEEDGSFAPVTTGRSMVVGLAEGPDGFLYHSQLLDTFGDGPPIGSVHRILEDGSTEPVVEGLTMPHGIAFDHEGNLFVATNVLMSSPDAAVGQVLRFDGIAAS